ncbi:MAG: response regulator [Haliangium ochraceum]
MSEETGAESVPLPAPGDILVVDDNPANLLAIEVALEGVGGAVVRAHSGNDALAMLLERDFALILLDVMMPGMGGLETAQLIRERKRSRHTPIIFVTAYSRDDQDVSTGYRLGAVDFLFKPIVPEILRAKASVFVELQRRTVEVERQASLLRSHALRQKELEWQEERRRWHAEAMQRRMEEMANTDRRKDEFLAMLGHELRNPLAPILTGLAVLQKKLAAIPGAEAQVGKVCERIERQARHLTRLVDDLLDISRISSGKIDLRKARLVLQDVIEQAVLTSRPAIDEAGHQLAIELPPEAVHLHGDSVRLTQVISNLLNNAARYTDPGGSVRLRCNLTEDRSAVEIHVIDNGKGISADLLPKVFEMFVQAHDARTGGLGLGLSLVQTLVNLHGGKVKAVSAGTGSGSHFTVTLPIAGPTADRQEVKEEAKDDAPAAKAPPPAGADPGASQGEAPRPQEAMGKETHAGTRRVPVTARDSAAVSLRIAVVEDNGDVREGLQELFIELGHHVEVASDGEAGVELILRTEPDFAFVDLSMPKLDGCGVARRVRESSMRKRVRLVAMTGYGQAPDRRRVKDAGFDAHLIKPTSLEAICDVLARSEPSLPPT